MKTPYRILIVEDSPEDRVTYKRLLRAEIVYAFEVMEVDNAAEGLALAEDRAFDCVVLDYHLPDAIGMEFIENFAKRSIEPNAAIVMVTGHGDEQTAVAAMKMGATDYIPKSSVMQGFFTQTIVNAIERSKLTRQIAKYQRDLEESNRALSEFAHVVSHDLKAPLRRIASFCALLQEELGDDLTSDAVNYMHRLIANAGRLQNFIDDLLSFSKAMHTAEEMVDVDFNQLMSEILEDLEPLIEENHATVKTAALPVAPAYPLRIRQLFMNLISNAIKYHGTQPPMIIVSYTEKADSHVFSVRDNGRGVPVEFRESIFRPFQRLAGNDGVEGTGLGLSICKKVIDMHLGKIWVDDGDNGGSLFCISLPKAKQSETSTT